MSNEISATNEHATRPAAVPVAAKLAKIMAQVGYVQKSSRNEQQGYSYASAEAVLRKVNEALSAEGVAMSTKAEIIESVTIDRGAGKSPGHRVVVKLHVDFVDSASGSAMACEALGSGSDTGDKAVMKATTAAFKYVMQSAFCISWGDDPEASAPAEPAPRRDTVPGPEVPSTESKPRARARRTPKDERPLEERLADVASVEDLEKIKTEFLKTVDRSAESERFQAFTVAWREKRALLTKEG